MRRLCKISVLLAAVLVYSCGGWNTDHKNANAKEIAQLTNPPQPLFTLNEDSTLVTLFLCGDVMTGRGIDQALPHPGNPRLYESYVKNAEEYLRLAEQANGNIATPISFDYIWGDALTELEKRKPDLRIINLETSITASDDNWKNKSVCYRMNPANIPCLTAAGIDGCALANNHVLDWGYKGLTETLQTLDKAGIKTAGAGENEEEAARPAVWTLKNGRLLLFSLGTDDSGVPEAWAAKGNAPGVHFAKDFTNETILKIKAQIGSLKSAGDIAVLSLHWGSNWGYHIPSEHRAFAHRLIEEAGVDIIHGHSSHHFRGIEVYKGKLILYGCGDFINDYEGISGEEEYRGDLTLMYFPVMDPANGHLVRLDMVPFRMRRFRLNYAEEKDAAWMAAVLNREGKKLGTGVEMKGKAPGCYLELKSGDDAESRD
ncbi:MAG: putative polyglutamine synthesis accessory protein [Saprospiraceae bacterium]|nr:putative polyglutamine synthesis accessory protein [Saprospiraceae bacterium]